MNRVVYIIALVAVLIGAVAVPYTADYTDALAVTDLGYCNQSNVDDGLSGPTAAYSNLNVDLYYGLPDNDDLVYVLVGSEINIDIDTTQQYTRFTWLSVPGVDYEPIAGRAIEGTATGPGTIYLESNSEDSNHRLVVQVIYPNIPDYSTDIGTWSGGTNASTGNTAYSSVDFRGTDVPDSGVIYIQEGAAINFYLDADILSSSGNSVVGSIPGVTITGGTILSPDLIISGTATGWGDITIIQGSSDTTGLTLRVVGGSAPQSTYNLQYNAGSGTGNIPTQTYGPTTDTSHTFTISSDEPTPPDYHRFVGWATSPDGTAEYQPGEQITLSIDDPTGTLYAIYEQVQYTYRLNLELEGGTPNGLPDHLEYGPTTDTSHRFTIPDEVPTRSGFTFVGWAIMSGGSALYDPGDTYRIYADSDDTFGNAYESLYAVWSPTATWTFYVYFDANGGSGAPATLSYGPTTDSSHRFTIPDEVPTWAGHEFVGWSIAPDSTAIYYDPGDYITVHNEDGVTSETLYAVWSGLYEFHLILSGNGGSGGPGTQIYGPTTDTSHTFTIPDDLPVRTGYQFTGWGTQATSGGTIYQPGDSITITTDDYDATGEGVTFSETLYAQWVAIYTYTLSYNANGGSGAPAAQTYGPTTDTSHTFTISSDEPTLTDSTFMGWSISANSSVEYQPGDSITLDTLNPSRTLYAVWTTNLSFSITYNANGGSGAPAAQTYSSATVTSYTFTITSEEPTHADGFVFMGWARDPDSDVAYYHGGDPYTVYASEPQITMYAIWSTYVTFVVSFDANGGEDAPTQMSYGPTLDVSHTFTIPTDEPTFQYRQFLGWSSSSSGSAQYTPGGTILVDRNDIDIILYAVWGDIETPGGVTISITGSTTATIGETRTLTAVVLPSDLTDRSVTWTVTAGLELIDYEISPSWRGSTLTYEAVGSGTVTIKAASVADPDAVDMITITISAASSGDSEVIGPQGIVGALGAALFGGSSSIAGVVLFAIILAVLFAIIREPLPVVLLGIPVLAIFTLLGILDMDMVILLIIVVTVGLALIARKMWRD